MKLILIGPQGSGKGTQAQLLEKKFSIPKISTGDILRKNIEEETELGKIAIGFVNSGKLVNDDLVNKIIKNRLKEDDCKNGFVLDGFPRKIFQAEFLKNITDVDHLLEIHISDKESIKRISGRRSCSCGMVYHTYYNPPKIKDVCDECGKKLTQRDDDKEDVIKKRLDGYHKETKPLIEFYKIKHTRINGEQPIEDVFKEILRKLRE